MSRRASLTTASMTRVIVACGGDGVVRSYDGGDFAPRAMLDLGDDADNVRIDPRDNSALVGYASGASPSVHWRHGDFGSGAVVLSWDFTSVALSGGALLIAAACVCWGIDNNLTRKLSGADPAQIAMIKGLAAGATNTTIGFIVAPHLPSVEQLIAACALGFVSYGVSLVFFVRALRALGAARTGAYFSTAPLVGALVALPLFQEPLSGVLFAAALLMGVGVWLHLTED